MIGLGAKYLTAAGFGRYRITAASLGRNLMFGSLWLRDATMQAIMAAFGVDGTAVIAATNEYLNGIAASDKAKATALAGFINEDPMMVCSLPMSEYLPSGFVMPVRWLKASGRAYIVTDFKATQNTEVETLVKQHGTSIDGSVYQGILGAKQGDANRAFALYQVYNSDWYEDFGTSWYEGGSHSLDTPYKVELRSGYFGVNGTRLAQPSTSAFETPNNVQIFCITFGSSNRQYNGSIGYAKFSGDVSVHFIPCHDKTQGNGMLDLVNVVFYPNAGSGSFTIPDISYTPTP